MLLQWLMVFHRLADRYAEGDDASSQDQQQNSDGGNENGSASVLRPAGAEPAQKDDRLSIVLTSSCMIDHDRTGG